MPNPVPSNIMEAALNAVGDNVQASVKKQVELMAIPVKNKPVSKRAAPVPFISIDDLPVQPRTKLELKIAELKHEAFIIECSCAAGYRDPRIGQIDDEITKLHIEDKAEKSSFGGFVNAYAEMHRV